MLLVRVFWFLGLSLFAISSFALKPAVTSSINSDDLEGYEFYPEKIKNLVNEALNLTRLNLTYVYGSNNPDKGGMDCSGTVQYLLKKHGLKNVPRRADGFLRWIKQEKTFIPAVESFGFDSPLFKDLKPGDILLWNGTYDIRRAASHVMVYLGIEKTTGRPVMFGASDDRRHNGKKITGVSVFDFKLPAKGKKAVFVGYGAIPGLTNSD